MNCWRRSAVLTSSCGAGTTQITTGHKRTNTAGAKRLGGAASPVFEATKAGPGMTSQTGVGLVPGGPPCSPEWSIDAGATPSDAYNDILAFDRDALALDRDALALDRDSSALDWGGVTLYPRSPPAPHLLQGLRWELGMVGLRTGPAPLDN